MRKLGNIVINEYIKILLKLSTIIMLIAVVLVAVGYNGLRFIQKRQEQRWAGSAYYESYDDIINRAKSEKYEGWEITVEASTFLKDNNITQKYNEDDYWINSAAHTMFEQKAMAKELLDAGDIAQAQKSQKLADNLNEAIKAKDWKAYNKINADTLEAVAADYKEDENVPLYESKEQLEIMLWAAKYQSEHEIPPFAGDWRYGLLNEVQANKSELIRLKGADPGEQDRKAIAAAEDALLISQYRLDNNIRVYTSKISGVINDNYNYEEGLKFWDVFTSSALGINFISVLIIIIAGSLISSEFSSGTVKYLLVNPVKRYKIFIAKYISLLTFAFLMLLIYYLFNILLSGIFFGFGDLGAPHLYVSGSKVLKGSSFLYVASKYLVSSVGMICMATFAFALSSVARSSALSIGLGIFLYLSGYGIVAVMSASKLDFGRYIIFSNLELNAIAEGMSIFKGQTLTFALAVIVVYMLVFLLTAWDGFVRRDVK
ncbi:MAG: ABC transporter permease [Oscillospiraceae bacterium]|nr:ABC transporter permease [Oscillospiraceae bacterium]MDD4413500.1 ABC transporter permease [Oscillospiraceae bacterium]